MTEKELTPIAIYHFKQMRTVAIFLHIFDVKKVGEQYIFYALFKGKKRMFPKKLVLNKDGSVIKM
jgi:hypothetical protein